MYSFAPLATMDSLNDHSGFYFFCCIIFVAYIVILALGRDDWEAREVISLTIIAGLLLGFVAAISYNTGSIKVYKNTAVKGELIGFTGEVESYLEGSGKQKKTVENHRLYVSYKTSEGIVTLPAISGMAYPQEAILYKN